MVRKITDSDEMQFGFISGQGTTKKYLPEKICGGPWESRLFRNALLIEKALYSDVKIKATIDGDYNEESWVKVGFCKGSVSYHHFWRFESVEIQLRGKESKAMVSGKHLN